MKKTQSELLSSTLTVVTALLKPVYPQLQEEDIPAAFALLFDDKAKIAARQNEPRNLLTRQEAANRLKVSLPTVNRLLNKGLLTRFKASSRLVRVTEESVNRLIASANVEKEAVNE